MVQRKRPLTLQEVAALLQSTPAMLHSELAALPGDAHRWHPEAGEWCINQVIGHLIEADRNGFAGRIQTILAEEQPLLSTWNISGLVAQRRDCERDGLALVGELAAKRAESAAWVVQLAPEQLLRAGIHPAVGALRAVDLLHEWVHHDRRHVKQILSNVQAYAWPFMGNARRFETLFQ